MADNAGGIDTHAGGHARKYIISIRGFLLPSDVGNMVGNGNQHEKKGLRSEP